MDDLITRLDTAYLTTTDSVLGQASLFDEAATALRAYAEREKDYRKALESYSCDCALDSCEVGTLDDTICGGRARAILNKHKEKA